MANTEAIIQHHEGMISKEEESISTDLYLCFKNQREMLTSRGVVVVHRSVGLIDAI